MRKSDGLSSLMYKTGDPHPTMNLLAFVEYDEVGAAVWASVYEGSEVPYLLARRNEQKRSEGKNWKLRNEDIEHSPPRYQHHSQSFEG